MSNIQGIIGGLFLIYDKPLIHNLKNVIRKHPNVNLDDAFSQGQIKSKQWLIQELSKITNYLGTTYIVGGWYGTLAAMLFENSKLNLSLRIRSFDNDPICAEIAESMNKEPWVLDGWKFKATTKDMFDLDYNESNYITLKSNDEKVEMIEHPDIIINTSCEHIDLVEWWDLIPFGKRVVLQSNNFYQGEGHVNCVNTVEELISQAPMSKVEYHGVLELEKYNRFMVIGIK